MEAKFGITYLGGKNSIAADIVSCLPAATHFIDLFCGGCGITHAAILSGKYKTFTVNDIDSGMPKLFRDAIMGKYQNENRWISRSDFIKNKDKDAYIRTCWSFGANKAAYMYSEEIEPWKRAMHAVFLFDDFSFFDAMGIDFGTRTAGGDGSFFKKRVAQTHLDAYKRWFLSHMFSLKWEELEKTVNQLRNVIKEESERLRLLLCEALKQSGLTASEIDRRTGVQMSGHWFGRSQWAFPTFQFYTILQQWLPLPYDYFSLTGALKARVERLLHLQNLEKLQSMGNFQCLENLQRLQNLQRLDVVKRLNILCKSYDQVQIPDDSVVYCDPPYCGCAGYGLEFDHDKFYRWCQTRSFPVFVSEYNMPQGFSPIYEVPKRQLLSGGNGKLVIEKLFVQERFANQYKRSLF